MLRNAERSRYFTYQSLHFLPVGSFDHSALELKNIHKFLKSDPSLGLSKYDGAKHPYSWEDFYKASGNSEQSLFYCKETGLIYIPGENELFIFCNT